MRTHILTLAALAGTTYGNGCHNSNDGVGKYCAFNPDSNAFLNAANAYCYQFRHGVSVPKGDSVYQMKIADAPDGYGGQQTFWGNYGINNGDRVHLVTYGECMGYMKDILKLCPNGHGGWVDTDFGTVFGECLRQ